MIGHGDEADLPCVVPQNSTLNIRTKTGFSERRGILGVQHGHQHHSEASTPLDSFCNSEPATNKCAHCENMAKNFLYLESLIRTNYNPKFQCSLCYSTMKYLQYVNKSILQVFGSFDSIVQAAKAFARPQKRHFKVPGYNSRNNMLHRKSKMSTSTQFSANVVTGGHTGKNRLSKKKSKFTKHTSNTATKHAATTKKGDSKFSLQTTKKIVRGAVTPKAATRKGAKHQKSRSPNVADLNTKSKKSTKSRSNIILRSLKQKNIKTKRNKVPMQRVSA